MELLAYRRSFVRGEPVMLLAAAASAHEGAVFSLLAGSVARVGGPREALLLSASNYCPRVKGTKAPYSEM